MLEEKTQQILDGLCSFQTPLSADQSVERLVFALSLLREELYNLRHDMQRLKRIEDDISAIRYYLVLKK